MNGDIILAARNNPRAAANPGHKLAAGQPPGRRRMAAAENTRTESNKTGTRVTRT